METPPPDDKDRRIVYLEAENSFLRKENALLKERLKIQQELIEVQYKILQHNQPGKQEDGTIS